MNTDYKPLAVTAGSWKMLAEKCPEEDTWNIYNIFILKNFFLLNLKLLLV